MQQQIVIDGVDIRTSSGLLRYELARLEIRKGDGYVRHVGPGPVDAPYIASLPPRAASTVTAWLAAGEPARAAMAAHSAASREWWAALGKLPRPPKAERSSSGAEIHAEQMAHWASIRDLVAERLGADVVAWAETFIGRSRWQWGGIRWGHATPGDAGEHPIAVVRKHVGDQATQVGGHFVERFMPLPGRGPQRPVFDEPALVVA